MPDFVKYKISVHSRNGFTDVLKALFARGFVFSANSRYKTIEDVQGYWGPDIWWNYVVIGTDPECSRVLNGQTYADNYISITLSDFLKLNY